MAVTPLMPLNYRETQTIDLPDLYKEPLRPQIHFSTKSGWINDPNGLPYRDELYHLFYQYNPTEPIWNNMHWGHAVSPDLIHWEEKPVVMFPSDNGTKFSGSAIWDEKNLLGLNDGEEPAMLAFYTATNPFSQWIAYSTDKGNTLHNFGETPVVPFKVDGNRDPKVIFCDELNAYIMALYLANEQFCLFTSTDLVHWDELQHIGFAGGYECPDNFPLINDKGERRWVLIGACNVYVVGHFVDGKFVTIQEPRHLQFGTSAYAGQSFSHLPNGRIVRIDWDRWSVTPERFNGQMGFPMELTLTTVGNTEYLTAKPVEEFTSLYREQTSFENVIISKEAPFKTALCDSAYLIKLHGKLQEDIKLTLTVFGRTITCDLSQKQLSMGGTTGPLAITNMLDLTVLLDRCSIEIYADNGRILMSNINADTVMDRNLPTLTVSTTGNYTLDTLTGYSLNSIWE